MSDSARGIMVIAIILFVGAMYYLFFMVKPVSQAGGNLGSRGTVANYLDETPECPGPTRMATGSQAPDFIYATMENNSICLSDYAGNKPVVIDFFATWCPPCRSELPVLQTFYSQYGDQVEIIAVSSESADYKGAITGLISSSGVTFPVIHDPSGRISSMFPTNAIPFLVFIDKDGKVVKSVTGYNPQVGEEILSTFGLN